MSRAPRRDDRVLRIRVGVFGGLSVVALFAAVFLVGRSNNLFSRKVHLVTRFSNISGLVVGAPVRLAGVDVGVVQRIRFEPDPRVKTVEVLLGVDSVYLDRIREDSLATLTSKGLLGDMIINITVGSAERRPLRDGDQLTGQDSEGLTEVMGSVREAIGEVRGLTRQVSRQLDAVLTPEVARDVGRITHSTANLLERVERGGGLVHALIYDQGMARDAARMVGDARRTVAHLDDAVARTDRIVAAVETGNGTAHALVYGRDGNEILREIKRTATELADLIAEVQKGRGVLHSLIYQDDRTNILENLTAASRTLRELAAEVDQGKGTIGALLKDPTIYEDLKTILGNVKRNTLLRTLVRYTIKQQGLSATQHKPPVSDQSPPGGRPVGAHPVEARSP